MTRPSRGERCPTLWVAPPLAPRCRQEAGPHRPAAITAAPSLAAAQPPTGPPDEADQLAAIARELRWGRLV